MAEGVAARRWRTEILGLRPDKSIDTNLRQIPRRIRRKTVGIWKGTGCRYPVAMLAKQRDGGYEQMKETSLCFLQIDVMVVNAAKSL